MSREIQDPLSEADQLIASVANLTPAQLEQLVAKLPLDRGETSQQWLIKLAKRLSPDQIDTIFATAASSLALARTLTVKAQLPAREELIKAVSKMGYFEQTIEVSDISMTLRTLTSAEETDCQRFARALPEEEQQRAYSRRRLSYSISQLNGQPVGTDPVEMSYIGTAQKERLDTIQRQRSAHADSAMAYLGQLFEVYTEEIAIIFRIWESAVMIRMTGREKADQLEEAEKKLPFPST
jgi:hypothetical protein